MQARRLLTITAAAAAAGALGVYGIAVASEGDADDARGGSMMRDPEMREMHRDMRAMHREAMRDPDMRRMHRDAMRESPGMRSMHRDMMSR